MLYSKKIYLKNNHLRKTYSKRIYLERIYLKKTSSMLIRCRSRFNILNPRINPFNMLNPFRMFLLRMQKTEKAPARPLPGACRPEAFRM